MKVAEILIEDDDEGLNPLDYYIHEIENWLGRSLDDQEFEWANREFATYNETGKPYPKELASWFSEQGTEDLPSSPDEEHADDDYTDYSMRQGEMGFPDRQR